MIDKPSVCERGDMSGGHVGEEGEDETKVKAAVFYSITSTQKGEGRWIEGERERDRRGGGRGGEREGER